MKKFIILFIFQANEKSQKTYENLLSGNTETINLDNKKNNHVNHFGELSIGGFNDDDYENIKEQISLTQKKTPFYFLLLIDTKEDICYIYKAKGKLDDIKKNILPKVFKVYHTLSGNNKFAKKIQDVRHFMINPTLN
ncbi:MAG: hypothetical protein B6229_06545 [Spirochaetaceae bacterium 4572_7]|nr:MAG: hypothetical protein B6229_06545 [Spirochaetaceae bacterium 4572_7]